VNRTFIDARLRELTQEECLIKGKLENKKIIYNKAEWYPSNQNTTLDDNLIVSENNEICYVSYMEKNNSFHFAPKFAIFKSLSHYDRLNVWFQGDKEGECQVQLIIITYKQKVKQEVFTVDINSSTTIEIDNVQEIRLALRIQGDGKLRLNQITLEPQINTYINKNSFLPVRSEKIKSARQLKVAMVVDEFTFESFKHEFNAVYLSPDNWLQIMQLEKPDIFFCESAWSGRDPDKREWRGKIYTSVNFAKENRTELLNIIKYCNENDIKTVFWNKEDPSHFEDKVHNFVDTALKFDYIFTTSEECVERYKKEFNHKHVYPLMFAVQPRQFNPIETYERTNEVVFAGSYYKQHPQRCIEMENIFDFILQNMNNKLIIYDRQYFNNDDNHKFPDVYKPYIRPRLPYTRLDKGYKGSKFALNINTEVQSNTMFARRVFELMASNTIVISNYSKGMNKYFGDLVFLLTDNTEDNLEVLNQLQQINYYQHRLKALRYVLNHHTYEDRAVYMLGLMGIEVQKNVPRVCVIMMVRDENEIINSIEMFHLQNYSAKRLLLINTGEELFQTAVWNHKYGDESISVTDRNVIDNYYAGDLTKLINTEYVAFMDLKYYYGLHYLSDMIMCYKFLDDRTIVSKNTDEAAYRFTNSARLYASVLPRKTIEYFDFDSDWESFVNKMFEIGYRIFNCDQFNILYPEENTKENAIRINI
jgi:hypothetical protein